MGLNETRVPYLFRSHYCLASHGMKEPPAYANMLRRVIVRAASPEFDLLKETVFKEYPDREWATFARFGWRSTSDSLVLCLAEIDRPQNNDLLSSIGRITFNEPYTLRTALASEEHPLGIGVVHSHPKGSAPLPSEVDDDMDSYFQQYFDDFAPNRPYVSLILSYVNDELTISGRVYWLGCWHTISEFLV